MLTAEGCRARLDRFRGWLSDAGLDGALVSDPRDLYWLCGLPLPTADDFPALAWVTTAELVVLCRDGIAPLLVEPAATYPWHVGYTRNLDNSRALAALAAAVLRGRVTPRLGFQAESLPHWLAVEVATALRPDAWHGIDDELLELQRAKEADELALLQRSVACTQAAYAAVQEVIAPGASELAVLGAGATAAVACAGEPVYHNGDYQCGEAGGSARDRRCAAGELYIVDAWTVYRGYWSDLCRTFPVGRPDARQRSAYEHLVEILAEAPERLEPGRRGTEFWAWMDARIREHPALAEVGLGHHAGHGTGLRAHTPPDLNRDREGVLQPGDVVCVEPGAYHSSLRGGVRVENMFLITEQGAVALSDYPLDWPEGQNG